jgi:non-ribosomal peptide synthetase component E (peptide arylation enzyme)
MDVGKTFAVQPGRGKPAVCRAKVISCENRLQHCKRTCDGMVLSEWKQREAELEGFKSWAGLMDYFAKHKLNFMDLYRIEFVI